MDGSTSVLVPAPTPGAVVAVSRLPVDTASVKVVDEVEGMDTRKRKVNEDSEGDSGCMGSEDEDGGHCDRGIGVKRMKVE
jgi:hypothetical protein